MNMGARLQKISGKQLVWAACVAAAAMLGVAFVAQYGFGLYPCELCLAQRVPYALIVLVAGFSAWRFHSLHVLRLVAFICAALFLVDAGIALYHSGVELGWFAGPSACTNSSSGGESLEELRKQIMNAALVSCDQPMAYIMGLSLASWNAIGALGLSVITFILARTKHD